MEKFNLKSKVTDAVTLAKTYWHSPPKGNYISYKEVACLSGAGFGVYWTILLASEIGLSASNYIVGACIGLKPVDLQIMLIVANLIGIPLGIFRSWYYDNHHLKGGKFLPFIRRTAFPVVLISTIFVWLPYENWSYITKAVVVEIMYLLLSMFLCFYNESYTYFQQIITPNAQERANVMSISQIIYSLAPTITNSLLPTLAGMTWGRDNIWTYRVIYPIFTFIGFILSTIFFRKVKERLVLPKTKPEPVRMIDALREVAKNKYFWLTQFAAWILFLESGYGVVLSWSFNYGFDGAYKGAPEGIANLIIGNAALWSMMLCPFAIKAMGKRNLLITMNSINVIVILALYFCYKNILLICILWYLNNFVNTFWNIVQHNISADMRDYHQWKTGVRVDGLFGPLSTIGTVIGFFTGMFYPAIYEKMGIHDDYSVLYNDAVRNNLFEVLIICSAIGAFLNLLPFIFYDLTENKHQAYVDVLKIRAMFINHSIGKLSDDELCEAMPLIHQAKELYAKDKLQIDKSALKAAKMLPTGTKEEKEKRHEAIKKAKAEIKNAKETNLAIERAQYIIDELNKFNGKAADIRLSKAEECISKGELYLYDNLAEEKKQAKMLPKSSQLEKEIRSDALKLIRLKAEAGKLIKKYGIESIKLPDESVKTELQNKEASNFAESMKIKQGLKAYAKAVSVYERATKPYSESKLLLTQAKDYACLDELEEKYLVLAKAEA